LIRKLCTCLLLALASFSSVRADEQAERVHAIEMARPSVVSIRVYRAGATRPAVGSGIILRSDGFILTNDHVVQGGKVIKIGLFNGKTYSARLWKENPLKDLALLKVEATGLLVARIGNSDHVRLGETAIAIGDPMGFSGTVTVGTVSGLGRRMRVGNVRYTGMIQTDASINPGSSGGALVDLEGRVIGMNTLIYNGNGRGAAGLGFAIPSNKALYEAKLLISSHPPANAKSWLGITGETLDADIALIHSIPAKKGVLVTGVMKASPAEVAKIRIGDAILQVNGKTIYSVADLVDNVSSFKPGDTITLGVYRNEKKFQVKVTLDVMNTPY
jgi:S1-C subfamily serine protease